MIRLELTRKKWIKYKIFIPGEDIDEYLSNSENMETEFEENGFYTLFDENKGVEQGKYISFGIDEEHSLYILITKSGSVYYFPMEITVINSNIILINN